VYLHRIKIPAVRSSRTVTVAVLKFEFVKPHEFTEPPTGSQPARLAPWSAAISAATVQGTLKLFALPAHADGDDRAPIRRSWIHLSDSELKWIAAHF
jgi:hypothetical protein